MSAVVLPEANFIDDDSIDISEAMPSIAESSSGVPESSVSTNWIPSRTFTAFYSGGKVRGVRVPTSALESFSDASESIQPSSEEHFVVLLACCCDDSVAIVDAMTSQVVRRLSGDSEPITSLSFHPRTGTAMPLSGSSPAALIESSSKVSNTQWFGQLLTCSRSLRLRLWDLCSGECSRVWTAGLKTPVTASAYDNSGSLIAIGAADGDVRVTDVVAGHITHAFSGHTGVITSVMFHVDSTKLQLFSASEDCSIRVWDLVRHCAISSLSSHLSAPTSLCMTLSGTNGYWQLVSGGRDRVILTWDLRNFKMIKTIPIYETIEGLAIVPRSSISGLTGSVSITRDMVAVSAGDRGLLRVWDLDSGKCLLEEFSKGGTNSSGAAVNNIELTDLLLVCSDVTNSRNPLLFSIRSDHNILAYNTSTLSRTKQLVGYNDDIIDVAYVPRFNVNSNHDASSSSEWKGFDRVAMASNSEIARIFNTETFAWEVFAGHSAIVISVAVSPDGAWLATGSKDNTVRLWDLLGSKQTCVAIGEGHTDAVGTVSFSCRPSGTIFLVSGSADKTLKVWDLLPFIRARRVLEGESKSSKLKSAVVMSIVSLLDDKLTNVKNNPVALSSVTTLKAHDKDINALVVSPNDSIIATASQDKTVKLWRVSDMLLTGTLIGHKRGVWCVSFSPVDQVIASGSTDTTIKIWSIADFSCVKTLEGHINSVLKLVWIPTGTQIFSAGGDSLIKLWNIQTSECISTLDKHEDKVWALAIRADGKQCVTGGGDSKLIVWSDVTAAHAHDAARESELRLLMEQAMINARRDKQYRRAAKLALELEHPGRLREVFEAVFSDLCTDNIGRDAVLQEIVSNLRGKDVEKLLLYIRDWNTVGRHAPIAQAVLAALWRSWSISQLLKHVPLLKSILEAIQLYTERHMERACRLLRGSYFIDFVMGSMQRLTLPTTSVPAIPDKATVPPPPSPRLDIPSEVDESSPSESLKKKRKRIQSVDPVRSSPRFDAKQGRHGKKLNLLR